MVNKKNILMLSLLSIILVSRGDKTYGPPKSASPVYDTFYNEMDKWDIRRDILSNDNESKERDTQVEKNGNPGPNS